MQGKTIHTAEDEVVTATNNWQAVAEKADTTLSASTWEWTGSGSVTSGSIATYITSANLTPTSSGTLRNVVTFANGEARAVERKVILW